MDGEDGYSDVANLSFANQPVGLKGLVGMRDHARFFRRPLGLRAKKEKTIMSDFHVNQ